MQSTFLTTTITALNAYVTREHGGNISAASESLGMTGDTLYKWLKGKRTPNLEALGPILDRLSVTVNTSNWLDSKPSNPDEGTPPSDKCQQYKKCDEDICPPTTAKKVELLFKKVLADHDGNKAAAARSVGVNPVTFWGWIEGTRGARGNSALFSALDMAGATLLLPGEQPVPQECKKCLEMQQKIERLTAQNEILLQAFKALGGGKDEPHTPMHGSAEKLQPLHISQHASGSDEAKAG